MKNLGFLLFLTLVACVAPAPVAQRPSTTLPPFPLVSATPVMQSTAEPEPTPMPVPSASEPVAPIQTQPTPEATALPTTSQNTLGMNFVRIEAGTFVMGSPASELGRGSDEVQRSVRLTRPFLMQTTEVTQQQWWDVMGENPSLFQNPKNMNRPVESVSWNQVQVFLARLNQRGEGRYRLPTEAEWEYAARAGAEGAYIFGSNPRFLKDYAWFIESAGDPPAPQPVAQKLPNRWGLYDIQGNVSEYVADNYTAEISNQPQTDPLGPPLSAHRVYRDCHYAQSASECRLARRQLIRPDFIPSGQIGFRLVRE